MSDTAASAVAAVSHHEEGVCGVCLEAVKARAVTVCGHAYCEACIREVLSRGLERSLCPLCRRPLLASDVTLEGGAPLTLEAGFVAAPVSVVWRYGDEYARSLSSDSLATPWLVVSVNYFHVGATVALPERPGRYVLAFRVKRLPQLEFRDCVALYRDGVEQRRCCLKTEIARINVWQLLIVGTVDVDGPRVISASMRCPGDFSSEDSPSEVDPSTRKKKPPPKSGLVVDCLVVFPPSQPPPPILFKVDDSRHWLVTWPDGTREIIHLRKGKWRQRSLQYHLRPTDPISFLWPDGTAQILHTVIDDGTLVWRTTHPDFPEVLWSKHHHHYRTEGGALASGGGAASAAAAGGRSSSDGGCVLS